VGKRKKAPRRAVVGGFLGIRDSKVEKKAKGEITSGTAEIRIRRVNEELPCH